MEKDTGSKIKTDLKHDTMEFTTPTNSAEPIEPAVVKDEAEEAQDAEVMNEIEDNPENEAAALNATETDLQADIDQLPDEDWTDDLPDTDNENKKNHHRS
jgi:hypothetical protein